MIQINLLPQKRQISRRLLIGALVLTFITLMSYLGLVLLEHLMERKLSDLEAWRASPEEELLDGFDLTTPTKGPELERQSLLLKKDLQQLDQKIALLDQGGWQIPFVLEQLSLLLPEEVWLTRIDYQKEGQILIQGQGLHYEQITLWLEDLAQIPGLISVRPIDLKAEEVNEFKVRIEVGEEG